MIPRVGQKIGPYEILGRLGSGGMGLVFSAWDARLHRDVAIKLLKDEYLNPTMRSRFLGEARAASRLNHPNICTIFDIGEEQDCPYMVMELLKGETLRGLMQGGQIPVDTILQVGTQVADALSVAHAQGIVHRDIKPANVVLVDKPNGAFQTKVLDFGLAKVDTGLDSHSGLTTTGMTVGTVSYMSPEQARGELLDGRSDLFSLGVVLYEMATKKLPFDGATSALIFVQLLNHPPEPLRNLNASVPRALEQVIATCLQKKREDRYQTAQELVSALHKAAQQMGSGERSASWFTKFTAGLKREGVQVDSPLPSAPQVETPEGPSPRSLSPDEAFLRPFRPSRKPEPGSKRYEPVNTPYPSLIDETPLPEQAPPSQAGSQVEPTVDLSRLEALSDLASLGNATSSESRPVSDSRTQSADLIDEPVEAPPHGELLGASSDAPSPRRWRVLLGSLVAAATVFASLAVVFAKRRAEVAKPEPIITFAAFANHTGDNMLSAVVTAGLELSLEQSHILGLRQNNVSYVTTVTDLPREADAEFTELQQAAQARGASAFVLGEIHMEGANYSLSLQIYDAAKGNVIGKCHSVAASRERIVGAVDSLATNMRSVLGDSTSLMSLSREATSNIDALQAYGLGSEAIAAGHYFDAIESFERATAMDPQFTQGYLRLAEIYMHEHAELSAAEAARHAKAAGSGDERIKILSDGFQSLIASEDYQAASDDFSKLADRFPNDVTGYRWLATAQRLQGAYPLALSAALQALRIAPEDTDALNEWKLALVGLDRIDEVFSAKTPRGTVTGVPNANQIAGLVRGAGISDTRLPMSESDDLDVQMTTAAALDAGGQMNAGLTMWRAIAQRTAAMPQLASSASFALAEAALDRALIGDCMTAVTLERETSATPAGPQALFHLGMAAGFCGNTDDARSRLRALSANYAQSFDMKGFYASDLNALMQWKSGALADALVTLQSASSYDAISFTPFLRGQVYLAEKQPQPATVEFQKMLRHPGQLLLMNPQAIPMTHLSLARAFIANGDRVNAAQSYKRLTALYQHADPFDAILIEARLAAAP